MNDFVKVAKKTDIKTGSMKGFKIKNLEILIANIEGKFYAMNSVCTHEQGPLAEGMLEGHTLTCPLHGAQFDVRTGKVSEDTPWAESGEKTFEVKVQGEDILVRI